MSKFEFIEEFGISKGAILENIQGGNSNVIKYQDAKGNFRSLKIYKGSNERIQQMYCREIAALEFLHKNGFTCIPQDLQVFDKPKAISYQWIDGAIPESDEIALDSVFEIINKLLILSKNGLQFDNAIDAAFSTFEIQGQIKERVRNLNSSLSVYAEQVHDKLVQYCEKFPTVTLFEYTTLSLSDIGIHNIIRNSDRDYFIDFEFFGYDSCAKMFGDFFLHPRNIFSSEAILRNMLDLPLAVDRLKKEVWISLPLLSLKWALIALGRSERVNHTNSLSIPKRNELQLKCDSYLRYFDFSISRNIDEPIITFQEFELDQFL